MKAPSFFLTTLLFVGSLTSFAQTTPDTNSGAGNKELSGMMQAMHNEMVSMKMTHDPDHDFASMMKMHHQAAVNMAQYEVKQGSDAELKSKAEKMIKDQKAEIAEFEAFLNNHKPQSRHEAHSEEAMMPMDKMMTQADTKMLTGGVDHDFAVLMMHHHQSAIDMSNDYLKMGKDEKLRAMATKIISSQQMEIKELKAWHEQHRK